MSMGPISATTLTGLKTTISATGAVNSGSLDISGITGDWEIVVRIHELTAASGTPTLTLQLEDSVNAFTNVIAQTQIQITGNVNPSGTGGAAEKFYTFGKRHGPNGILPNLRAGTTSAVLRLNATVLGGTTPSCTLDAWMNY